MESRVNQFFNGTINGVEFDTQALYYATEIILQGIEEKKGIPVNDEVLTADIKNALEDYYFNVDGYVDLEEVGYATYNNITSEYTLRDIRIYDENNDELNSYEFIGINELVNKFIDGDYDYLLE